MTAYTGALPGLLAGDIPSATDWAQILNALHAITDAWGSYSPAWTTTGTAPAIVNGTITGEYGQAGKLVVGRIEFAAGSSTTFGTGNWRFSLPVTPDAFPNALVIAGIVADGSGTEADHRPVCGDFTGNLVRLFTSSGGLTATSPFTWASTDRVRVAFMYPAT